MMFRAGGGGIGLRIGIGLAAAGLLIIGIGRLRSSETNVSVQETDYGSVPPFSLIDSNSRVVTQEHLRGKVWIADFIFTSCAGMCPMMSSQMRKLQDTLPVEIQLVSISVDPSRDTPEVLAHYSKQYGADSRWMFLTGEKQALYDLSIKGFRLGVDDTQGTEAEPITHSARFVLVDRDGRIRGYFSGTEEDALKALTAEAKRLL